MIELILVVKFVSALYPWQTCPSSLVNKSYLLIICRFYSGYSFLSVRYSSYPVKFEANKTRGTLNS